MAGKAISLLKEECDLESITNEVIEEGGALGKAGGKNYYIVGPYVQANTKNGNGRTYPLPVLEAQVQKYMTDRIQTNRAMGELGHPSTTEINLDRVSHLIKEMKMDGDYGMGKSQLLDTPMGMVAKALIDGGVKLGVSSRGVGTLKENIVQADYRLITVDIVADPSAPDAFVDGILESQKEWILENGILREKELEQLTEKLDVFAAEDISTATTKLFKEFMETLCKK